MRNILAVGAYERDNFGDFLFLEVLCRSFPEDNIIPSSIIFSNMTNSYGLITVPYDYALSKYKFDAIWVVGGEVGSVDVHSALIMSLPDKLRKIYKKSTEISPENQIQIESTLGANRHNKQAYIPSLKNYSLNTKTPLIVNSVGLSYAHNNKGMKEALMLASKVCVREEMSKQWCDQLGIKSSLLPDAVHAISKLYTPHKITSGLVFHANKQFISDAGSKAAIETIKNVVGTKYKKVTLIAAGLANMHDSHRQLQRICDELKKNGIEAVFNQTRSPLEIVDIIAGASIVISTSLHVRIIASAYGINRISLKNDKVANYAKTWDRSFPYDVDLRSLELALEQIELIDTKVTSKLSDELSSASMRNIFSLGGLIATNSSTKPLNISNIIGPYVTESLEDILTKFTELSQNKTFADEKISALKHVIEQKDGLINELNEQFRDLLSSKSYKIGKRVTSPYRAIKKTIPNGHKVDDKLNDEYQFDYVFDETSRLAVVVHLFYPDLWIDIRDRLKNIKQPFDLYISVPEGSQLDTEKVSQFHNKTNVIKFPNRGRDVLPFLTIIAQLKTINRYDFILKIHTKKSKHRNDGNSWFNEILDELLPKDTHEIFDVLTNSDTGLVGPAEQVVSLSRYIGDNSKYMEVLISRMFGRKKAAEILDNMDRNPFFGGTMFWARIDYFEPLLKLDLKPTDFPIEEGQVDGTIAHAIERVIGKAMHRLGGRKMYTVNNKGAVAEVEDETYVEHYKHV